MSTKPMTTAGLRDAAVEEEHALCWGKAADLWDAAADVYPRGGKGLGELAALDIGSMRRRAADCRAYAGQHNEVTK